MKTITRTLILILAFGVFMPLNNFAQSSTALSKKAKRKEKRMIESQQSRKQFAYLLQNKAFVLEANQIYGPRGNMIPVSPTTNFFAVRKNKVIFQYGIGVGGRNGVGGMTAEGFITDYKFNPGKNSKKALTVSGKIMPRGSIPSGYFSMEVSNNGSAYLYIDMPVNGRLSMSGQIVPLPDASVYKGFSDL